MNKKLEELFDLPEHEPTEKVEDITPEETYDMVTSEAISNLDKIDRALPAIKGLESSDKEMDELAELATTSYKDLIQLGMQLEARHASEVFSSASQFLGHAITAKQAKINKKIKLIELQLKKAKLDLDSGNSDNSSEEGLDRNEILAEILNNSDSQEKD